MTTCIIFIIFSIESNFKQCIKATKFIWAYIFESVLATKKQYSLTIFLAPFMVVYEEGYIEHI